MKTWILKFNGKLMRWELWEGKNLVEASNNEHSLRYFAALNGYKIKKVA